MTDKTKVKVIKKDEVKAASNPVQSETKTKRKAARNMVSNVSTWVSDFQVRKRDETKIAIEKFFNQSPQPSEL